MNFLNEAQIEVLLRRSPQPRPPAGLKERLVDQARAASQTGCTERPPTARLRQGWFHRWWPALLPATFSVACLAVMAVQQVQIRHLKQIIQRLSASAPTPKAVPAVQPIQTNESASPNAAARQAQEVARLKKMARQLTSDISELEHMRAENKRLQAQLNALATPFTPEQVVTAESAHQKALTYECVIHLKQIGLALHIWAADHHDACPTNLQTAARYSGFTPKILVCPLDESHQAATNWATFRSTRNCSYQYLAPTDLLSRLKPNRVLLVCPKDGNVWLCNSHVQQGVAKTHPNWLVKRDGKLYLQRPRTAKQTGSSSESSKPPPTPSP